jgi:hypothetical protein
MQSYVQIQAALDARLQSASGLSTAVFIAENTPAAASTGPTSSAKLYVRSTLLPNPSDVSTLGADGYVKVNGLYAIDVMGPLDKGYTNTKALADNIVNAFVRGTNLSLSGGDFITIENAFMSPNVTQGAWRQAGFYCVQVIVRWYGFVQP